ncbi:hypothetical protein ACNI0F_27455, partial [Escherichia coli]
PVKLQGVAFVKHVSLLTPQGDLVVPEASKCVFCVKNMQTKDERNADLITLGRNHSLDEQCAKMRRLKVQKTEG